MSESGIQSYRDLRVWQRGMELAEMCFRLARALPAEQRYGLTAQIQRAASSIPANIAEGHGRRYRGDYVKHPSIARGSLCELESHLHLAQRLGWLTADSLAPAFALSDQLGRMLFTLHHRLASRTCTPHLALDRLVPPRTSHPAPRT